MAQGVFVYNLQIGFCMASVATLISDRQLRAVDFPVCLPHTTGLTIPPPHTQRLLFSIDDLLCCPHFI